LSFSFALPLDPSEVFAFFNFDFSSSVRLEDVDGPAIRVDGYRALFFGFGRLKKLPNVDCIALSSVIPTGTGMTFSFPDLGSRDMISEVSRASEEAWGVRRGELGGEDSNIKLLEEAWAEGRALPYVRTTGGLLMSVRDNGKRRSAYRLDMV